MESFYLFTDTLIFLYTFIPFTFDLKCYLFRCSLSCSYFKIFIFFMGNKNGLEFKRRLFVYYQLNKNVVQMSLCLLPNNFDECIKFNKVQCTLSINIYTTFSSLVLLYCVKIKKSKRKNIENNISFERFDLVTSHELLR